MCGSSRSTSSSDGRLPEGATTSRMTVAPRGRAPRPGARPSSSSRSAGGSGSRRRRAPRRARPASRGCRRRERRVGAEGVQVAAVLADDRDDHGLRGSDPGRRSGRRSCRRRGAARSLVTSAPNTSSPTRPPTATGTSSFAARPRRWRRSRPARSGSRRSVTSSPAAGSCCSGGTKRSATRTPKQTTRGGVKRARSRAASAGR